MKKINKFDFIEPKIILKLEYQRGKEKMLCLFVYLIVSSILPFAWIILVPMPARLLFLGLTTC